jgi:putative membrane protein
MNTLLNPWSLRLSCNGYRKWLRGNDLRSAFAGGQFYARQCRDLEVSGDIGAAPVVVRRNPIRRPVPGRKDGDMADQQLDASTRLAVERTRLANERTLMAWIRTSTSLIAFGFTIFKFFQYLATQEHRHTIVSPWVVGMAMILVGLTGLALAWVQHRQQMKALKAEVGTLPYSISGIMAGLIAVLGVIALVVVMLRL